jgi:hypothetical protein
LAAASADANTKKVEAATASMKWRNEMRFRVSETLYDAPADGELADIKSADNLSVAAAAAGEKEEFNDELDTSEEAVEARIAAEEARELAAEEAAATKSTGGAKSKSGVSTVHRNGTTGQAHASRPPRYAS